MCLNIDKSSVLLILVGIYPRRGFEGTVCKGFLVTAVDKTTGHPVGIMRQTAQTSEASRPAYPALRLACGNTSLTHNNNEPKEEVFFQWMPPADFTQDVVELR